MTMKRWNSCLVWGLQSLYQSDALGTGYTAGRKDTGEATPAFWRGID